VAVFFVSYIVIVAIMLLNVIVAVLLEGFMTAMQRHDSLDLFHSQ